MTYNEEKNIRRCIQSVQKIADEVIVVDSYSDDATVEIAQFLGAIVKQSKFDGYISQKNKAIALAKHPYVLLLDADESLTEELANSILEEKKHFTFKAYSMKRCSIFCGREIRHGLWYPDKKLRLFDKRLGNCGGMNPHDRIVMPEGTAVKLLKGDMMHAAFASIKEYQRRNEQISNVISQSMYDAGARKYRFKIIINPLWAFINGYILRLGFIEGREGFIIAVLAAQQTYLKYQKLRELLQQEIPGVAYANKQIR
ncbi:glycosyltransferase family 2 protein [Ferruginibacter sp.]